jgi:cytochrome c biogenesis protein CcdA
MVATVNPCGFAMLPAYLAWFLGLEGEDADVQASVSRSLGVGLTVSAGFLLVFGLAGLAIYHLQASIYEWVPWATIVIGVALGGLGLAMLRGFEPVVALPKLQRGGRDQDARSMLLFGISYAVTSISCALPLFTSTVVGTFRRENVVSSAAVFVAYALGMTLVLVALTVSLGMARQGLLRRLRQALPFVNRVAGALILVAGLYLAHYGWYERRVRAGDAGSGSTAVDTVTGWSSDIGAWVSDVGPTRLGLLLSLGLAAVLTATFGLRARR